MRLSRGLSSQRQLTPSGRTSAVFWLPVRRCHPGRPTGWTPLGLAVTAPSGINPVTALNGPNGNPSEDHLHRIPHPCHGDPGELMYLHAARTRARGTNPSMPTSGAFGNLSEGLAPPAPHLPRQAPGNWTFS